MKKSNFAKILVFILSAFTFISCCESPVPQDDHEAVVNPIESNKILKSDRIDVRATRTYFYKFEYEGHSYLTNQEGTFIYHLQSCSCNQNKNNLNSFKIDYSNPFINE